MRFHSAVQSDASSALLKDGTLLQFGIAGSSAPQSGN
jgi:hypothetical protein